MLQVVILIRFLSECLSNDTSRSAFRLRNNLHGPNCTCLCLGLSAYMVWSYMALSLFSPNELSQLMGNSWNKMWTKRVLYFMSTGTPLSETWRMTQAPPRVLTYTCRAKDRHQHAWVSISHIPFSKKTSPNLLSYSAGLYSNVTSWVSDANNHHPLSMHVFRSLIVPAMKVFPLKCLNSYNTARPESLYIVFNQGLPTMLLLFQPMVYKSASFLMHTWMMMHVKCVLTWEVFERHVRVGVVSAAANYCIKDMLLLLSISLLSHHFPFTGAWKVRCLSHALHWGLKCMVIFFFFFICCFESAQQQLVRFMWILLPESECVVAV